MNFLMAFFLIVSSPIASILFLVKWMQTDIETAWNTFEDFVENIFE